MRSTATPSARRYALRIVRVIADVRPVHPPTVSAFEFIIDVLLFGLWFWLGVVLGLLGAWVAWTYLPESEGRDAIAAMIFIGGCVLGVIFESMGEGKKK